MEPHDLTASDGVAHTMFTAHAARPRAAVAGPIKLGTVAQSLLSTAVAAASMWNTYLPATRTTTMDITAASLPGNVVGRIWLPCAGTVCNVTIDPSYGAPFNVLVHEFGHGIGLPRGAVSSKYPSLRVDADNHWSPATIDPREIMTAVLDPDPYLALYTIEAISPSNHRACTTSADCRFRCHDSLYHNTPGYCSDHPGVIHHDDAGIGIGVLLIIAFGWFTFALCVAPVW